MTEIIGIVVLILLFIFVLFVLNSRNEEQNLLTGFWSGGPSFCKQAELDMFMMYFGEGTSNIIPGYILVKNSDGLIINNPVAFKLSGGNSFNPRICRVREYVISIDWLGEDPPDFFPSMHELHYYPKAAKLVFVNDGEVYAVLYKDNAVSDYRPMLNAPDDVNNEEPDVEVL